MKRISSFGNHITANLYGGKAYWLNWLYEKNISVPHSLFIPVKKCSELEEMRKDVHFITELQESLQNHFENSSLFAVRSSALDEDGFVNSKAGYYCSLLNVHSINEIINAISGIAINLKDHERLGIIIQDMIQPVVSGVLFSSNPINGKKDNPVICVTSGIGDNLMSGLEKGEELQLKIAEEKIEIPKWKSDIKQSELESLVKTAKKIENDLNLPVDIEWCIEKTTRRIVILQCRPMTGLLVEKDEIVPVNAEAIKHLPDYLVGSDKIRLREMAEENNIMISNAYLMVRSCRTMHDSDLAFNYKKAEYHSGYSIVLVSPSQVDGKVQRFFVGEKKKVYRAIKCQRFGVRDLADYNQVEVCLHDLFQIVGTNQWACSAIIQEILDAEYTGIIRKITDGFVIEIAKGHFLSKGIIPMTSYLTDDSGRVAYRNEIMQNKYISIVEGCVLEHRNIEPEKISIPDICIKNIINSFKNLLLSNHIIVEFGILNNKLLTPYIIDCMPEETKASEVTLQTMEHGIISGGNMKGRLVKLDLEDDGNVFDVHFHNRIDEKESVDRNLSIIFYAKMPSIQLLDVLGLYDSDKIAFVFEEGSMLCHLSVLLRERKIPAIRGIKEESLEEGAMYQLDTSLKVPVMKLKN